MKNSAIKQSIMLWFVLTWELQAKYTNVGWVNHSTHYDCKSWEKSKTMCSVGLPIIWPFLKISGAYSGKLEHD